ncbi:hypothetical protein LAZ67_8001492 [Cordylochernes scorpioides]|uniref:Uncharacterized protein n=1 Tax=Cordylochernes scorpioides TaxID=51811 RepID=A0ABY6KQA2_9ARAC|nr:hypothetical protein LAZ67_8001492 [Cordylochernes scorpioides]
MSLLLKSRSTLYVPSPDYNHKQQRMKAARDFLEMHRRDGDQPFSRIVTGDESWVHHSIPETNRQSMVWKKPEESAPKKTNVTISAGKVMAIAFWDCKGVLLVDYLPPNTKVNSARRFQNPSDDSSKPADDALASDPDSSKGKAQGSQEVPEIAVEDSDEKSAIEDSQPSEPLDVEGSGVGSSSDVEVRAQTKSPKAISSKVLCMKKEESSIDLEEEDTGRNEPSPASITFKALETTDSKEIDLTILGSIAREHCAQGITFEQSRVIRTLGLGWIQGSLRIPRWLGLGRNIQGVKLHGFGNDSEDAYAAAVYIRIPTDDGVSVRLLASKTKLAPMWKMSIPRLELCAALLLTRLVKYIMEELDIKLESATCWSDSTIVLSWLRTMSGNLPTFIGNRVAEIQSCPQVREWRYVPTGDNPADIAKRGNLGSELKQSSIWWTGPTWLSAESTEWPRMPPVFEHQGQTELLSVHALSETPFLVATGEMRSTFDGYIRKVAWIFRYCHNCRYSAERY